jgi:hypothetical protein
MLLPSLSRIVIFTRSLPAALTFFKAAGIITTSPQTKEVSIGRSVLILSSTPSLILVETDTPQQHVDDSNVTKVIISFKVSPNTLSTLIPSLLTDGNAALEGKIEYSPNNTVATVSTSSIPGAWFSFEEPEEEMKEKKAPSPSPSLK